MSPCEKLPHLMLTRSQILFRVYSFYNVHELRMSRPGIRTQT